MPATEQIPKKINLTELTASICRDEFYFFVEEFWPEIAPAAGEFHPNWHIKYICDVLQEAMERVFRKEPKKKDFIINQPPGTTKSSVVSVALPAWALTRTARFRAIVGSYTELLSLDLSRKCRDVVKSQKYQEYFPEVQMRADQDSKHYWMTTRGGARISTTVGGDIVGMHADLLVSDDPINPDEAGSILGTSLQRINRWHSETLPSRAADKRISVMILLMQRLAQNDPSGYLLDMCPQDFFHICLPSELGAEVRPPELAVYYKNGLLAPTMLPKVVLEQAKIRLGAYGYASQHLQQPIPRGGGMFKIEQIRFGKMPEAFADEIRYWDKAYTHQAGKFTVGFRMGRERIGDTDRFWGLDVKRGQWESGERENVIAETAYHDGTHVRIGVEEEPAAGKGSAQATARRLAGYRVILDKVSKSKPERADPWATQVNNGNFWLPGNPNLMQKHQTSAGPLMIPLDSPPWVKLLLEEMQFFPFGKYSDQIDSGGSAFQIISTPRRKVGGLRYASKR